MSTGRVSDRRSRGAGVGAAAYFLLTGIIFATWASRVPAFKGGLDLGDGQFAVALLALEAGAVLGLQLGGLIVPRVGSRRALTTSLVVFTCALLGPGDGVRGEGDQDRMSSWQAIGTTSDWRLRGTWSWSETL